nr:glycoside hydrolase family 2 protein [uncultured Carboxylicivirga sp.]
MLHKLLQLSFILGFIALYSCSAGDQSLKSYELQANWTFRQADKEEWHPATVPGNVHIDLEKAGIIDNPFYGTNEDSVQWIEHKDWVYSGEFSIDKETLDFDNIELEFLGLDTYADVTLNGQRLFSSDNMFVAFSSEVKKYLKPGKNHLEVLFHSPIKTAMPLHEKSKYTYPADNDRSKEHLSVYTRKAPYHYGWDWGPRFVTSGIWRPIKINAWNDARITDVHFVQKSLTEEKAEISFEYEIEATVAETATISLSFGDAIKTNKEVDLKKGINKASINITVDKPDYWWPNGMGEQKLYTATSELKTNGQLLDSKTQKIGLRTIEVINKPDSLGVSFYFKVNGIPTFMRGVNYIPNDCFLGRMTDSIYQNNFDDLLASNMNMLRFWGGGVYEDDRFFELADEKGILLWQDFMFACTMYPSDDAFLDNVAKEANYNIKRLRNHPSLAIWCGNNEVKVGWHNWGWQDKYGYTEEDQKELLEGYDKLFNQLLPNKLKELDSQRFYYDSSPISNWGDVKDMKIADNHYWGVWWGKHEFEKLNEYVPRFMSEFGFQSFPPMETIKEFSKEKDWDIESDVMKTHQKSSIGNVTIKEYMQRDYKMPDNFEDFVYLNQIMQAEGMRVGFEAQRRNKPFCMGTLYWQLNDVWPVVSWSGIDYYGRWKAMQYFIKKAYEPVITSAVMEDGKLKVHLISDKITDTKVSSSLQIIKLDGTVVWEQTKEYNLEANANRVILNTPLNELIDNTAKNKVILVMNTQYDSNQTETTYLFSKVKDLALQNANIDIQVKENGNSAEVTLKSPVFVKNIELIAEGLNGKWSDNYFDMIPNKEYKISFNSNNPIRDLKSKLQVKSVINTY